MKYADMLKHAIDRKGMSLQQLCFQLAKRDVWVDKAVLSKLQNGKCQPANDDVNKRLAEILGLDMTEFRLAAAKEKLPTDLWELIQNHG